MARRPADMTKPKHEHGEPTLLTHDASKLSTVGLDSYNLEIEDEDGFFGDKGKQGRLSRVVG